MVAEHQPRMEQPTETVHPGRTPSRETDPIRVTFVVPEINLGTGGGSHHSFKLTTLGLFELGIEVRVLVLEPPRTPEAASAPFPVTFELSWQRPTRIARLRAIAEIMQRYEADTDVFHLFDPELALAAGLYRVSGRTPVAATLNNFTLWCTDLDRMDGQCQRRCGLVQRVRHARTSTLRKVLSLPFRIQESMSVLPSLRNVDHFFPNSPATQRIYREAGFDLARSTVVPALIDIDALRASATRTERRVAPCDQPRQMLFSGRLTHAKGVDILIDALPHVAAPVHLHVAGEGSERPGLEARARRLGIQDRVTFHGWIPNRQLWELIQRMQIFVHPGRWPEPCGRSVQEALALGLPTIVSDIGGPPWLVGQYGRTFRPGDARDLARQIDGVCREYPTALSLAREGIQRAAEFDYRRWVPTIAAVYTDLLGRHSSAPTGSRATSQTEALSW